MPEMTDAEINATVAIEVMGWNENVSIKFSPGAGNVAHAKWMGNISKVKSYIDDEADFVCEVADWHPTTNLNQAFEAAKAMGNLSMYLDLKQDAEFWRAGFYNMTGNLVSWSQDPSPARAICAAALAAKRGEK